MSVVKKLLLLPLLVLGVAGSVAAQAPRSGGRGATIQEKRRA